jgi:hypothetical protein
MEPRLLGGPACSLVIILTSLSWLPHTDDGLLACQGAAVAETLVACFCGVVRVSQHPEWQNGTVSYTKSTRMRMFNKGDALCVCVCHDMMYLLTAIGLAPSGSSTVHVYTQTIHRTTKNKQHKNSGRVRAVPHLGELYPGICLKTVEKVRKNLSQGSRTIRIHTTIKIHKLQY